MNYFLAPLPHPSFFPYFLTSSNFVVTYTIELLKLQLDLESNAKFSLKKKFCCIYLRYLKSRSRVKTEHEHPTPLQIKN